MNDTLKISQLAIQHIDEIIPLTQQLNSENKNLKTYQTQMFDFDNYHCFGFYLNDELIGLSSGWITVRLYSGKQLEVDNVIIDEKHQSKGFGKQFFELLEDWAIKNLCQTIELNTYIENTRSHKFYDELGFKKLGFHYQLNLRD